MFDDAESILQTSSDNHNTNDVVPSALEERDDAVPGARAAHHMTVFKFGLIEDPDSNEDVEPTSLVLTGVVPVSLSEEEGTTSSGDDMREDRDYRGMVPGRL